MCAFSDGAIPASSRAPLRGAAGRRAAAALLVAAGLGLSGGGPAAAQAPPASPTPSPPGGTTHEMEVMGLAVTPGSGQPAVILRSKADKRELTMFIDPFTAQGILLPLQGQRPPRPYTHDLMAALLRELKASLVKVVITDLRDNTYFATIHLRAGGRDIEVDSRPSDAIALALRENVPILAEERAFRHPPAPQEGAPR